MPVSHEHKLILVHIPKTGGTSIENALDMHGSHESIGIVPYKRQKQDYHHLYGSGMQHMTLKQIRDYYSRANFEDYKLLGGVKHLIDLALAKLRGSHVDNGAAGQQVYDSYYKFAVVRNPYDRLISHFSWMDGKWHKKIEPGVDEFRDFVDKMIEQKLYETDLHLIPQFKYLVLDDNIAVDSVLHMERLNDEFNELCSKLNIETRLEKRMVSKHKDYRYYYDENTRKKVYDLYQKDFELFGYTAEL